jgi:hypothetical protein
VCCAFAFCWWHGACQARASESSTPPEARKKTSRVQALARCWANCANAPLPAELAALLGALNAGHGINLYLRL